MLLVTSPYGFIGPMVSNFVKAQRDVVKAVEEMGGRAMPIYAHREGWDHGGELTKRIDGLLSGVEPGDTVIVQIPTWNDPEFELALFRRLRLHNVTLIAFIHDLLGWMSPTYLPKIEQTLEELHLFDAIISHSDAMTARIKATGDFSQPFISLDMFDYRHGIRVPDSQRFEKKVIYAGDLQKINQILDEPLAFNLEVLSPNAPETANPKVVYGGFYDQENVPIAMQGGFGLVWSAEDTPTFYARSYSLINNPFKASMYLSANLPIIVQDDVPLAKVVKEHHLGLVVGSFTDLNEQLEQLTEAECAEFASGAAKVGKLIRQGFFTKRAVFKAIEIIHGWA
jgi:hypothetical protein